MRLAHKPLMSGHLGTKKTSDRVVAEFFWPGICGDVARFCKILRYLSKDNSER